MTDEPTPLPIPEPADEVVVEGQGKRRAFLRHFPRSPVPGTDLTIRSSSIGQDREMWTDAADKELDDRELTVRLVQRQLDQELPIEDVRAWDDGQLIEAAAAFLRLARDADCESDEVVPVDDEEEPAVDPGTFADVRHGVEAIGLRRAKRMRKLIGGIVELNRGTTGQLAQLIKDNPAFDLKINKELRDSLAQIGKLSTSAQTDLKALGGISSGIKAADLKALGGISSGIKAADLKALGSITSGIKAADLAGVGPLSDTKAIGSELSAMLGAAERSSWSAMPPIEAPHDALHIAPITATFVNPEIELLGAMHETLEKLHDDELRTAEHQIGVMVEQARLLKAQGEALSVLVEDVRSQKWMRRIERTVAIVAAAAAVAAALYASGVLRPVDSGATSALPAPVAAEAPTASP